MQAGEILEGVVRRIVFSNDENGWTVLTLQTDEGERVSAVGTLLGAREGDRLRLTGEWSHHDRFGRQFSVRSAVHIDPTTPAGIQKFLASARIPGIGPTTAERLVDRFGVDTLQVLEHDPDRLTEVRGIGAKTAAKIRKGWKEVRGLQQIMVFLHGHGVSPSVALKLHKRYGATALQIVRDHPYRLAREIYGVGFLTADNIAKRVGIARDAPERLRAGLLFSLQEAAKDGHVHLPLDRLIETAAGLLGVDEARLTAPVEELARMDLVASETLDGETAVSLKRLRDAEIAVAERLTEQLQAPKTSLQLDAGRAISWYQREADMALAPDQQQALEAALTENVLVITGGPGTGKTTLIRGVTQILKRKERTVALAAPTGRAAKRLQEATGLPAKTIHRLLEYNPMSHTFGRCREVPIEADLLVVDEASMIDIELAASLLEAVPPTCRLILVGDADQLPSVGPGNVLRDVIASGALPVVRLERIFRQSQRSLIVVNAHRINHGDMPVLPGREGLTDFYFVAREDPEAAAETALDLVTARIPARFGLDPVNDVQVLTPMHRGVLGVSAINDRMRRALNPGGPELAIGSRSFRIGDKVMQVRNNYDLEIYNGDLGRVVSLGEEKSLIVSFDGRRVVIPWDGLEDLVLAYACTIHKSQGSEYPAVVILLHHQHHVMLQRNLLYTAVTRGRRLVIIVGSRRALARAVGNASHRRRHTLLAERLRGSAAAGAPHHL